MSIATEITRLQNAKSSIKTAIEGKGVEVPSTTKLDGYGELISSIPSGGDIEKVTGVVTITESTGIRTLTISHNKNKKPFLIRIYREPPSYGANSTTMFTAVKLDRQYIKYNATTPDGLYMTRVLDCSSSVGRESGYNSLITGFANVETEEELTSGKFYLSTSVIKIYTSTNNNRWIMGDYNYELYFE